MADEAVLPTASSSFSPSPLSHRADHATTTAAAAAAATDAAEEATTSAPAIVMDEDDNSSDLDLGLDLDLEAAEGGDSGEEGQSLHVIFAREEAAEDDDKENRDTDPDPDLDPDLDLDEEEEEEEEEEESSSEQGGQGELKRSLDRFAFITLARVEARGPRQYEIFGEAGLPILHARVRALPAGGSGCCRSSSSGNGRDSQRPFQVQVSDFSSRRTVMRLLCDRYHCSITVESPPNEVIGYLTAERILCALRFTVRDLHGNPRLRVHCPSYCQQELSEARCQPRRAHRILLADDESTEVARLHSVAATASDGTFRSHILEMPECMSTDLKAMLIGVALLFDRKLLA